MWTRRKIFRAVELRCVTTKRYAGNRSNARNTALYMYRIYIRTVFEVLVIISKVVPI